MQALASEGVIGDFHAPDTMRFGFAPLYLTFTEVYQAAVRLRDILVERRWDTPAFRKRTLVT
jgi:kynureninase